MVTKLWADNLVDDETGAEVGGGEAVVLASDYADLAARLAEAERKIAELRQALAEEMSDEVSRDAARWRYVNSHAEWRRQKGDERDDGFALLAVRLPYDADLSCPATRAAAIDAALERQP